MMKIIVLSDTHSRAIPDQVADVLSDADFVIHAGDIADEHAFQELRDRIDVKAVCGNMDSPALRKILPSRLILTCEKAVIGVTHGEGSADQVLTRIQEAFANEHVDAVVFGHSHEPVNKRIGSVLYFNPGSPNDDIFAPYCSYGVLEIDGKKITSKIIKVE